MTTETEDLEPQQYARHFIEDDVPLKDVRKSTLRRAVYIGLGLFTLIVLAGSLIKFPDEVSLPFVLRGATPEQVYRYPYPVYIEETYAAPGATVQAGAPLVRITSPEIVTLIGQYRQAGEALANYRTHKTRSVADTRDMMRLQAAQNAHVLQDIAQRQSALEKTWSSNAVRMRYELDNADKQLVQHQALYQSKDISALELKSYETAQMRASDALNTATLAYQRDAQALREEAARYSLQNTSLVREEDRVFTDARTDSATLSANLSIARDAIRLSFGEHEISGGSLVLKAPGSGTVSFLFAGEREVAAGAVLLRFSQRQSGVYAAVVSPPSLIGKLKQGQAAYLKVATFPAYEWGAARGHIEHLSLTPDEQGSFTAQVRIDDERQLSNRLQAGMDGTVAIQLEERTFFQFFFRKLKKIRYMASGE